METETDFPETHLAMRDEQHSKKEYFVIQFLEDLSVILEGGGPIAFYRKILNALEGHPRHNAHFAKNTNLLILLKVPNLDHEKVGGEESILLKIYEIEENPYFFKKHIVTYTDSQIERFKAKWPLSGSEESATNWAESLQDFAAKSAGEEDWFEAFKRDVTACEPSAIRLLAQLFVKIPFFQLKVLPANLANLKEKIDERLEGDLVALRNFCLGEANSEGEVSERSWLQGALTLIQNPTDQSNG